MVRNPGPALAQLHNPPFLTGSFASWLGRPPVTFWCRVRRKLDTNPEQGSRISPPNYYEVRIPSRGSARCSRRLRGRSCKFDQYHRQPSFSHRYQQSSGPSWLYRDWKFRKRQKSGTVASGWSFVEDFADKFRDGRGHDWLDWRSDMLGTRHRHHHCDCSPEPATYGEQWSAEHILIREWYRHTGLSITIIEPSAQECPITVRFCDRRMHSFRSILMA